MHILAAIKSFWKKFSSSHLTIPWLKWSKIKEDSEHIKHIFFQNKSILWQSNKHIHIRIDPFKLAPFQQLT